MNKLITIDPFLKFFRAVAPIVEGIPPLPQDGNVVREIRCHRRQSIQFYGLLVVLSSLFCIASCALGQRVGSTAEIASAWRYFSPLTLQCQMHDYVVNVRADFSRVLKEGNVKGDFDKNSVRVVEMGRAGMPDTEVPSLFSPDSDFEPATNARGWIRFRVRRSMPQRTYRVYFDILENGEKPFLIYGEDLSKANWLDNGGFERLDNEGKSPEGWNLSRRTGARVDETVARSGRCSVKLLSQEKGQVASLAIPGNTPLRVEAGERYLVRLWTKAHGLNDRPLLVSAYWFDADRNYVTHEKLEESHQASWEWTPSSLSLLSPPEARWLRVFIATYSTQGCLWVDDISILPVKLPELTTLIPVTSPDAQSPSPTPVIPP